MKKAAGNNACGFLKVFYGLSELPGCRFPCRIAEHDGTDYLRQFAYIYSQILPSGFEVERSCFSAVELGDLKQGILFQCLELRVHEIVSLQSISTWYEYIELKNNTPCLSGIYFVLCLFHALFHRVYSVIAFFRPARRTHSFRTFLLQSLMKMLARLMLSFLSFMGVMKKAPFCYIKSPFLLYKKPLFHIQKGAFSIIPLREKTMPARQGTIRQASATILFKRNMPASDKASECSSYLFIRIGSMENKTALLRSSLILAYANYA